MANEAVKKVVEGLPEDDFGDGKTIPKQEIVQYSAIVKGAFFNGIYGLSKTTFYSFNI